MWFGCWRPPTKANAGSDKPPKAQASFLPSTHPCKQPPKHQGNRNLLPVSSLIQGAGCMHPRPNHAHNTLCQVHRQLVQACTQLWYTYTASAAHPAQTQKLPTSIGSEALSGLASSRLQQSGQPLLRTTTKAHVAKHNLAHMLMWHGLSDMQAHHNACCCNMAGLNSTHG